MPREIQKMAFAFLIFIKWFPRKRTIVFEGIGAETNAGPLEDLKTCESKYHTGFSMYMVPLNKWEQHGPDSNLTIAISLCFKHSSDEGPIFTIFYWKAVQGLKHIYVVKNTSSEIINCLDFILSKPFLAFRGH